MNKLPKDTDGKGYPEITVGENFVDTAIKILMAVVIGGLVLDGSMPVWRNGCADQRSASRRCSIMQANLLLFMQGSIFVPRF